MGCHVARRLGLSSCAAMFVGGLLGGFLLAGALLGVEQAAESEASPVHPPPPVAVPQRASPPPLTTPPTQQQQQQGADSADDVRQMNSKEDDEDDADTYEPHVVKLPPGADQSGGSGPESVPRPMFYSTELGTLQKLYVAVLTSPETVASRAVALNRTLAHITPNIGFYMSGPADTPLPPNLHNVVIFSQENAELALRTAEHVAEHDGQLYDYFFLVTDASYVRGYRLQELAEQLSVASDVLLGATDCTLDGGLLLSRRLLASMAGRATQCHQLYSASSRDAALLSCLQQETGVQCSDSAQGHWFVSTPFGQFDIASPKELDGLVTVRDLPAPSDATRLHASFAKLEIEQLDIRIGQLRQALVDNRENLLKLARAKAAGDGDAAVPAELTEELPWPVGSSAPVRTTSRHHINMWQRFSNDHRYLSSPDAVVEPLPRADAEDVRDVLQLASEKLCGADGCSTLDLKAGYRRFDGGRGMDYVLELEVVPKGGGPPQRRRVEMHRPMLRAELVPMPFVTEKPTVTVVLPVTPDQVGQAQQFIQNVITASENLSLVLYLIAGDSSLEVFRPLVQMVQAANKRPAATAGRRMGWLTLTGHPHPSQFFIMDAVARKVQGKQLILMLNQPGIEYRSEMFNRARMQTIRGWEVFCPIPWVEYHPDLIYNGGQRGSKLELHKNFGEFDADFYGIMSFYISDYMAMRNRTLADVPVLETGADAAQMEAPLPYHLYGAFVRHSGLHVHRAVDPNFRLQYFQRHCPAPTEQQQRFHERACVNSMLSSIGSQQQLAEALQAFRDSATAV